MTIALTQEQIREEGYALLGATFAYTQDGALLMAASVSDGSDSGVGNMLWRSEDEGKRWARAGFIEKSFRYDRQGSMVKMGGNAALYADAAAEVILFTGNELFWEAGCYESTKRKSRLYYRLSFYGGRTFTDKRYVVLPGRAPDAPIPDVVFGRNFALSMASQTLRASDGALLVALQCQMTDEGGGLIEPAGFHFFQSGALRAAWNEKRLDYDWDMGDYVRVSPEKSTRGVFEPTFARLDGRRVLMVMRASNYKRERDLIGRKFYAVSEDDGRHWSAARPLDYDDGGVMYSSSSVPKLWAHSSGRLYYIGVINARNPEGNGPRAPLCIAEIDRTRCCVIRESVCVIDRAREGAADYTNHGVYEDSCGHIVVYAPFKGALNRYEIEV